MLLYELLAGAAAVRAGPAPASGLCDEMQRIIREEEPPKPSTRLSTLGATATEIARQRRRPMSAALSRELRGDLDWITLKALEKDRTRRYASASELAADVARHLRDEPVAARPPSIGYRATKFARRHRGAVVAGSVVAAAIIVGLATSMTLYFRSETARADADRERLKAQRGAYVANMNLAEVSLESGDSRAAMYYLDRTEPALRGWEWRHFLLKAESSLATLQGYRPSERRNDGRSSFSFSDDGTQIFLQRGESIEVWDTVSSRRTGIQGTFQHGR